jgi:hypothetical protein
MHNVHVKFHGNQVEVVNNNLMYIYIYIYIYFSYLIHGKNHGPKKLTVEYFVYMKKIWLWVLDVKFLKVHAHETLYVSFLVY